MSYFVGLNLPTYNADEEILNMYPDGVCVCCLAANVPYVNLSTCKHTEFLESCLKYKIDLPNTMCYVCHEMLHKIERFKQQVQDSILILNKEVVNLRVRKMYKMEKSPVEITVNINPKVINEVVIENEPMQDDLDIKEILIDIETPLSELKEQGETNNEAEEEIALERIKQEKSDPSPSIDDKYVGKLKRYLLTGDELENERDELRREERYLKDCMVGFNREPYLKKHIQRRHGTGTMEDFLRAAQLGHLRDHFIEQGVDMNVLLMANEQELSALTTRLVDKIKLRNALQRLNSSQNKNVQGLQRRKAIYKPNAQKYEISFGETSMSTPQRTLNYLQDPDEISTETSDTSLSPLPIRILSDTDTDAEGSADTLNQDWNSQPEFEVSNSTNKKNVKDKKNLRNLLSSLTVGKLLLKKADSSEKLSSRDRAFIAKLIVETELRELQDVSTTIRKNIWQQWAGQVVSLFKGEVSEVYYSPYHVTGGKVVQASGLFHNRLITHRRLLLSSSKKRKATSSLSSDGKSNDNCKRVRPLPNSFNVDSNMSESSTSPQECLDWLRGSSSPKHLVATKWRATFHLRNEKPSLGLSYTRYFNCFPALTLPDGHELLSLDFQTVYPDADNVFEEKFPIVKTKILSFLAEKGSSSKQDQNTLELLDLATVGEEEASLAAFMGIICLLRQVPTVTVPRKKAWRLSKEEVRSSFIGRVNTTSDIDRYCADRDAFVAAKGIPSQPYILAVGTSWATVTHYEIIIYTGLRYQMPDVCSAIKKMYHIYWALDAAYPKDSAICWMFIQRAMFNMKSKYDTEGVPLRELLHNILNA